MKQKMRFAVSLAAALALLGGSALAVAGNWNVLNAFFEGDTSAARDWWTNRRGRSATGALP